MHHWFLSYHSKDRDFFSGSETFTFFDLIPEGFPNGYFFSEQVLDEHRKTRILSFDCGNAGFVLNTTHRFIRIGESDLESIFYTDFICHRGYNSVRIEGAPIGIKSDGYFAEFGLKVQSREIIYWLIPSGRAGFAFWNVTKKCELIGRKYL